VLANGELNTSGKEAIVGVDVATEKMDGVSLFFMGR